MSQLFSNNNSVPLYLAAYFAVDNYDYEPGVISATRIMQHPKKLILASRTSPEQRVTDVADLIASRTGTSIHDGVEHIWTSDLYKTGLRNLGYPEEVIERIKVNVPKADLKPGDIPVYAEERLYKEFMGYMLSGKFDFIGEGVLHDLKTTGTFTWEHQTKVDDYKLQGSIYRLSLIHI